MLLTASEAKRYRQRALAKAMQRGDEPTAQRTINGMTVEVPISKKQTLEDITQANRPAQSSQIGAGFRGIGDLAGVAGSLEEIAAMKPEARSRFVETGEGGYTDYYSVDPGAAARTLLAQPKSVSADYIRQNFPTLGQLSQSTLESMGKDWRNAYGQMAGLLEPTNVPKGYVTPPVRMEGGKPFLSLGGPSEVFAEAAPYVTYDPNYGLTVPQQGIQPYREKFGIMNVVPSLMLGAALGPLGTAFGGGIGSTAAAGALGGGLGAAINEGNILKGALTGGLTAGLGTAATPYVNNALASAGIAGPTADALRAGTLAAGKAAITGGDPLQAALTAATGAGVTSTVSGLDAVKDMNSVLAKALTAAASGAARAAAGGGDPIQAALNSAINVGTNAAFKAVGDALSGPSTRDIVSAMQAQDVGAQQLQNVLAQALPEQQGLLAGDYKQEGLSDLLARGAESALGAIVPSAQAAGQDRLVLPQPSEMEGAQPRDYKYFFDIMAQPDPQAAYAGLSAEEKAAVDRAGKEFQASSQERQLDLLSSYRAGDFAPTETPTESYIDQGLLSGAPVEAPATTAEDYIDRGGLGGAPAQYAPTFAPDISRPTQQAAQFEAPQEMLTGAAPQPLTAESVIDAGGLMPSLTEPQAPTEEPYVPIGGPTEVAPTSEQIIEAGVAQPSVITPTESAIDSGQLTGGYQTTPIENVTEAGGYQPTESAIDRGELAVGYPMPLAGGAVDVGGYAATPTEGVIDTGGMLGGYTVTPTEGVIDTGGLTGEYPNTPTENVIDTGGLAGGYPSTPTEEAIDSGGLGTTPATGTTTGGTTQPADGATQPAGGATRPTQFVPSGVSASMLSSLLSQFAMPVSAPEEQTRPLSLKTQAQEQEFEGPLAQFFKKIGVGDYASTSQPRESEQPMMSQRYFNYGQENDIDSILGDQQFASGGLAAPLMAAEGGLPRKVVHHSGKMRMDFRGGAHVSGPGDGQSDDIPAMLADGEFVFPADVVSALGNGSTKAGSDKLYEMMHEIRTRARSSHPKDLPPPAKSPLDYLKDSRKSRR